MSKQPKPKPTLAKIGATGIRGTLQAACAHIGLDRVRFVELQARGVFPQAGDDGGYDFDEVRISALKHTRDAAAGRGGSAGERLSEERAKLAQEQSAKVQMDNAVRRGELIEVDRVVDEYVSDLGDLKSGLSVIPSKVGQECATMTPAEIAQYVATCIDDAFIAMRPAEEIVRKVRADQMGEAEGRA